MTKKDACSSTLIGKMGVLLEKTGARRYLASYAIFLGFHMPVTTLVFGKDIRVSFARSLSLKADILSMATNC